MTTWWVLIDAEGEFQVRGPYKQFKAEAVAKDIERVWRYRAKPFPIKVEWR